MPSPLHFSIVLENPPVGNWEKPTNPPHAPTECGFRIPSWFLFEGPSRITGFALTTSVDESDTMTKRTLLIRSMTILLALCLHAQEKTRLVTDRSLELTGPVGLEDHLDLAIGRHLPVDLALHPQRVGRRAVSIVFRLRPCHASNISPDTSGG